MDSYKSFWFRHKLISALIDIDVKGVRRIAHNLPSFLIPKPRKALVIDTQYGFYMKVNPLQDYGVESSLYYTGTYEKGTLHIMKQILKEGDTFVDVGANIGLMSLYASRIVKQSGKVYAFEPHPGTREILMENIKINQVYNIYVSPFAVGSQKGKSKLYDSPDHNRGSASITEFDASAHGYDVNIVTLSEQLDNQDIRLIKIDVEGYELEALKGADQILIRDNPPALFIECSELRENTFGQKTAPLYDYIKSFNRYRVFKANRGKERISRLLEIKHNSELPQHDNLYCFTDRQLIGISDKIFV